ncbi:hypothetical protein GVN21_19985 [Caulobacter sp. SLTY]|uniref:hypothetical protein n=1 Tax=Caulobacter sp. SLTY TaxID=2683262 RepID=UPI001411FD82|nr:hypothetical protein [Caulobacter sp. SLTY]NBB17647.1 hypothetical protein [Caulobacter sp. SLTY]
MVGRAVVLCVALLAAVGAASRAEAVCIYRGVMYAQSTITGEFRESSLVIKGTVIENIEVRTDSEVRDFDYVIARIRVDGVFKGIAGREVLLISERNSGGFYVNEGEQYLLFFEPPAPASWSRGVPRERIDPLRSLPRPRYINNGCGQSVRWSEVSAEKRRVLDYEVARLAKQ